MSWEDQADFTWSEPRSRRKPDPHPQLRQPAPDADWTPGQAQEATITAAADDPAVVAAPDPEPVLTAALPPQPGADPAGRSRPAEDDASAPALRAAEPARRTVVIKGHGQGHYVPSRGGYEARLRPHERTGFKPDRVALWAVLLGLALLLGAVTSSHAAVLHPALIHHLFQHAGTP